MPPPKQIHLHSSQCANLYFTEFTYSMLGMRYWLTNTVITIAPSQPYFLLSVLPHFHPAPHSKSDVLSYPYQVMYLIPLILRFFL